MKFDGVNMSPEIDEDKLLDSLDENELLSHIVRMRRSVKEMYSGVESGSEEFVIAELAIMTYSSHRKLNKLTKVLIILTGVLIFFTAILVYFTILLASKPI